MLHEQSQFTSKFIPTSVHDILKQSDLMDCAIQASDRSQKKKVKFCGIFRDRFPENFHGSLCRKTVGKKRPISWEFAGQILLEIEQF